MAHLGGSTKARITFCDIGNIHVMRSSLQALIKGFEDPSADFFAASSRWLEHVSRVLEGSVKVADALCEGQPCLVRCFAFVASVDRREPLLISMCLHSHQQCCCILTAF